MHTACFREAGRRTGTPRSFARPSQKGLAMHTACNVYRADRQFNFCRRTPCVPRPCAADVISRFRNKKRQHINASTDISVCGKTGISTVSSRVTNTSTRLYEASRLDPGPPDSPDVRFTDDPSQPPCLPNMPRPFSLRWNMNTKLGRRQPRGGFRGTTSALQRHSVRFQQLSKCFSCHVSTFQPGFWE